MSMGYVQQVGTPLELYDDPANVFVASFIGLPPMNFFNAKVCDEYLELDSGVKISLDDEEKERLSDYVGKEIKTLTYTQFHTMIHECAAGFDAMGLKGKEISSYLGNSHYKQSSSIRKKLGLTEHDTNLDLYLRGIIAKLQSKSLQ